MTFKKQSFCYIFALLFAVFGAVLFFTPVFSAINGAREYADIAEAEIFFISFFAENKMFLLHSFSVVFAFLGFLCSVIVIFKKKNRIVISVFSLFLSAFVICAYVAGYDKIFSLLY